MSNLFDIYGQMTTGLPTGNERTGEVQNFSQSAGALTITASTDPLLRRDYEAAYRGMTQELAYLFATPDIGNLSLDFIVDQFTRCTAAKHFRKVDNIVYGGNTASYWIKTELAAAFRKYINKRPSTAANEENHNG